jgi:hypothetical protein
MKIIHQNGFSDKERAEYRPIIYKNLTESAQSVVLAMRKLGLAPKEPINRVRYESPLLAPLPHRSHFVGDLGERRQNYGLRRGPYLPFVIILLSGGRCSRRPPTVAGSRHLQTSGQPLERVLSDG